MAYLGILLVLIVACSIQRLEDRASEKQNRKIEELHAKAYEWIDENTSNIAVARERKAEIDTMINNCVEQSGRKYDTHDLKQVTTKKERKARNDAELEGERYVSSDMAFAVIASQVYSPTAEDMWEYAEHTDEEKREHYIGRMMDRLGVTRAEAERRADIFYGELKG